MQRRIQGLSMVGKHPAMGLRSRVRKADPIYSILENACFPVQKQELKLNDVQTILGSPIGLEVT